MWKLSKYLIVFKLSILLNKVILIKKVHAKLKGAFVGNFNMIFNTNRKCPLWLSYTSHFVLSFHRLWFNQILIKSLLAISLCTLNHATDEKITPTSTKSRNIQLIIKHLILKLNQILNNWGLSGKNLNSV